MKHALRLFYLLYFLLVSTVAVLAETPLLIDRIVAVIDGEPITRSELNRYAVFQGVAAEHIASLSPAEQRQILNKLIAERLFKKEARASGIEVEQSDIDSYLEQIQIQNRVDESTFEQMLKSRGVDLKKYREQIESEILRAKLVSALVRPRVNVLDGDVEKYFSENREEFPASGSLHLHQIFVRVADGSEKIRKEARKLIEQIRVELTNGSTWELAGGENYRDVGFVAPEELRSELREILEELQVDEPSSIVETKEGFYLVKVSSAIGEEGAAELFKQIRDRLYEEKLQREMHVFLTEELPKKYHVEIVFAQ